MKRKNVHIGEIIKMKVEEKGLTISDFAELICCSRSNVYNLFKSSSIDLHKLLKISEVLEYDFYNEVINVSSQNNQIQYNIKIEVTNKNVEIKEILKTNSLCQ